MDFKQGSILNSQVQVFGHCVNCQGVMGAGIAKLFASKYPASARAYELQCKMTYNRNQLLGTTLLTSEENNLYLAHIYGQCNYGRDKRHLNYEALYTALEHCKQQMIERCLFHIAFPDCIGCGLAGGAREIIVPMIEFIFSKDDFKVEMWKVD
jgi:O-acetyl-ADP-ribose deacetylase (regulator of RNase III)